MLQQTLPMEGLDVTITTTMQVMGVVVALALQFVKAFAGRWPSLTDEMKKPLWPLLSIALTALCFWLGKVEDPFVSAVVVGLAACGGYDLFAGASRAGNGPKPTPVTPMLAVCALVLFAPGCQVFQANPRAELLAAEKTFSATVDSLTALQRAGQLTAQETAQITILVHQGKQHLDQWHAAVLAGQVRPDVIESFQVVLDALIQHQAQKE